MSAELNGSPPATLSPPPRELAATLFRHPQLVADSFGFVLLTTIVFVVFSARYESHFKVLLRRGRFDPIVSSQPASAMDFTRPEITEEERNSEFELLRDEDLLNQGVTMAGSVCADNAGCERPTPDVKCPLHRSRHLVVGAPEKMNRLPRRYSKNHTNRIT